MNGLQARRYTQADVLAVTRLRKELLQTWINRRVIALAEQNPGSGKRRLYSAIDVVKLGLMRRVADLGLDLAIARDLASDAERMLIEGREVPWELHLSIKKHDATQRGVTFEVIASAGYSVLALKYGAIVGDARDLRVAHFTEPFESMFRRRKKIFLEDGRPMDPERRDALAKAGIYAEPAVIFPFGEIVNGTLLQLAALREGHLPDLVEVMLSFERQPQSSALEDVDET